MFIQQLILNSYLYNPVFVLGNYMCIIIDLKCISKDWSYKHCEDLCCSNPTRFHKTSVQCPQSLWCWGACLPWSRVKIRRMKLPSYNCFPLPWAKQQHGQCFLSNAVCWNCSPQTRTKKKTNEENCKSRCNHYMLYALLYKFLYIESLVFYR